MNRKQFVILLVLLAVLGGAGLLVQKHSNTAATDTGVRDEGGKLLGDNFPINDVAAISIQQGTNALNLVKADDLWRVRERNNYAADFSKISGFLVKAADLKILETEQLAPADLPRLQLAAGQGTDAGVLLTLKDKDGKTLKALTLGKSHFPKQAQKSQFGGEENYPDGRYVMLAGDSQDALLLADPMSEIEPKPELWLNKDFFKVERPKTIAVDYPDATNSWRISRVNETGDWKLAGLKPGETENTTNLPSVTSPFVAPSFDDVLTPANKPEETGLDKPTTITVDTFDDFTYTVKVGKKSGDGYPITMMVVANFPKERIPAPGEKPEDKSKADKAWQDRQKQLDDNLKKAQAYQNWVYVVPGWSLDSLLKNRADLVTEKVEEPKPAAKSDATASKDSTNAPAAATDPPGDKQ